MDRLNMESESAIAEALYHAVRTDDIVTLKSLKRDTRALNYRGRSLLAWACYHDRVDIAQWLLAEGADPSAVDIGGWSVLKQAVHRGDDVLVDMLIKAGGDPKPGRLLRAAWLEGHTEVYRVLVHAGVHDPYIPTTDHRCFMKGGRIRHSGLPLTDPPIPLYAPVDGSCYVQAAITLVLQTLSPIRLWSAISQRRIRSRTLLRDHYPNLT